MRREKGDLDDPVYVMGKGMAENGMVGRVGSTVDPSEPRKWARRRQRAHSHAHKVSQVS